MKRSILAILILAAALMTVGSDRERIAQADGARSLPVDTRVGTLDDPQTSQELTEELVKVDAVKRAYKKERLEEAKVDVSSTADSVRIRTEYPDRNQSFSDSESRRYNNPAEVEYTLTIPRKARIDSADLVNGSLEIDGAEGDVKAACVNGQLKARGLTGDVKLSTVNGGVEATITRLEESKSTSLNSVNGSIVLTIPSDSNAQVKASTIHGSITNDFGLQVNDGDYVGHDLSGQIGNGGPRIRLSNVNGSIAIKRG